jgi:phage regulator Rha-like protein
MGKRSVVGLQRIENLIYLNRGQKVMLDADLAELYGVETRVLKQAVRRNRNRFPSDFMFELTNKENRSLRSQNVILERGRYSKYLPFAFTEQGVAMLSTVLNSERAIEVNIALMRVFVRLREMMATHKELSLKLRELESRIQDHDEQIVAIFGAIRQLMTSSEPPRKKIGFEVRESAAKYGRRSKKK